MYNDLIVVLSLALLPAGGNVLGGLVSELFYASDKMLNRALHAATGIILAVVSTKVMPDALQSTDSWVLAIAFVLGGGFYILIKTRIKARKGDEMYGVDLDAWMVYVAVSSDLIGDGLLIGAGTAVSRNIGAILALGQVLADIPEGYAVISNFKSYNLGRFKRMLISASFSIPVLLSALFSFFMLRGQSISIKMACLVFVSGLYTIAAVENMLSEAHKTDEDSSWSAFSFLMGFALFMIVSGWLD
jgi:ZIP family zinc transporter